jgi:outer membrane protein OmpA-like peptidoglycan-associated protein
MYMKIKVLILTVLSGFVFSAAAQEFQPQVGYSNEPGYKTNFKKNKFKDNWFISAGAGMGVLFGDQNNKADFKNRLNANPFLNFGKWWNPYLGTRIDISGGVLHGFAGSDAQVMQHNKYILGQVDFMWDVTNFFGKYNEKRFFRFIPFIGVGGAQRFKISDPYTARCRSLTFDAGILTAFRLCDRVDFNIEANANYVRDRFNNVNPGGKGDIIGQLRAGLTVKLGKTTFEVIEPMDYALLNDLNNQINKLRAENAELSKRPVSCPECEEVAAEEVVNNYVNSAVRFSINSSKINKDQDVTIYNVAQFVKDTNTPITVVGYADKKTGTNSYNMQLSEKRAKAVAKVLMEKYNIPSNMISVEWKGSDVQPFGENNWNRVVIMSAQ